MHLPDFQYSAAPLLVIAGIKWLLLGLLVATSPIWHRLQLAIPFIIGIGLAGVGALFKIEHWTGGDALLIVGAMLLLGTYCWWFKAKVAWKLLDFLKLAWVGAVAASLVALVLAHAWVKPLTGITSALFWAVALLFVYQRWIRRPGPVAR